MVLVSFGSLLLFATPNILLLLTIATTLLFFVYKNYKFDVWEKQGVKGPKPISFFGNSLEQFFTPILSLLKQRHEKYGNIFGFYDQSTPVLNVAEPELLRYIMVKDSDVFINKRENPSTEPLLTNMLVSLRDEKWKRTRAIVSPTFTSGKIKKMTALIDGCVMSLLENIELKVKNNEEIDVKALYGTFTVDVIASCAFGTKTNAHKNPNDPFIVHSKEFFAFRKWRIFALFLIPRFIRKAVNFNKIPSFVISFFKASTKEIIKQRKENNVHGNDFLQLLLDSEKSSNLMNAMKDINAEQLNNENQEDLEKNAKLLETENDSSKLAEDEILAQCLIFFIAGYETTASLLSYSTYALALNPECQQLLYEEVKHYFDKDKEITYETINKMKYLNAFINETLRMYSPVTYVELEASKDYKLPNTDIIVPKGAIIEIPLYIIHHDETNFPEPDLFKPERFLPENIDEIKPYTFMPFGSGPRNCIGMRFALMEAKLALCNVVLHYKFVKSENTDVPLRMKKFSINLLPVERVIVRCERRNV